jgi:UDP-GlcNAc:undecaprenyl-phosphate GlcNAc-1-phosphate transferase
MRRKKWPKRLKNHIKAELAKLMPQDPEERIIARIDKYSKMGHYRIFAGTICGIVLWTPVGSFGMLQYILAAFVLVFLIGILDDLLPISPAKKLGGQFLVAIILAYKADVRVASFYGFFGLHELSEPASFMLTIVVIVGIVNAFNFIDGINGLGGSVGLLTCLVFGTCLHLMGALALAVVAFSLAGATLAFLWYNFSPAKIFMGDTGSLLMGTVCAILAITFIETNHKLPPGDPYILGPLRPLPWLCSFCLCTTPFRL